MLAGLPDTLKRILAVRLDNIGDVVMTGPALRSLRRAFPAARITLMASPAGSQVGPLLPWVDHVFTWRAVWQDISSPPPLDPEKEHELVQRLIEEKFDAAFIFTSFSQSPYPPAYACYLAGIPIRAGQSNEFGGGLLTHWIPSLKDSAHQVDRNIHLLSACGIPTAGRHLELRVPEPDQASGDHLLIQEGIEPHDLFIVLAPGASAQARRYDENRFSRVARQLVEQTGLRLILLGSSREAGQFPALEALAAENRKVISLIGKTSVAQMAAVISRSTLLLANNSGSMHIASAFDRPSVILFSGTELPEQWAPDSAATRLLNQPTFCTPCHAFRCRYSMECLDIPVEEVVRQAVDLLDPSNGPVMKNHARSIQETGGL